LNFKLPEVPWSQIARLTGDLPIFHLNQAPVIRPKILPEVIHPVIVVPGFLGSWPSAFAITGGKLDPVTGVYTNLIEALQRIGYVPGISLFPFPFDWRLGIEELGTRLGREIERIRQLSPLAAEKRSSVKVNYSKVDIVAHSMGGLVCRAYLQGEAYAHDVSRVALVATPNAGVVAAYYGYEGGETTYIGIPTEGAKSMIALMDARENKNLVSRAKLTYLSVRGQADYNMQQYLSEQTASVRDLLPVGRANYLYSQSEAGQEKPYPFGSPPGYPVNASLEKLNTPEQLARLDGVEEIYCFYSNSMTTRRRILVEDRYTQSSPLYQHGYPVNPQPAQNFGAGDTIVSEESARLELPLQKPGGQPWQVRVINQEVSSLLNTKLDHVQLVADPVPVRHLLTYLTYRAATPLTPDLWDGPSISQRKPNYAALFI